MRKVLFAVSLLSGVGITAAVAQEDTPWEVPDEAKAVENPVENTAEAIEAGGALYKKHCTMCHGETGKGDGPATKFIKPSPPDISTAEAQDSMTDGEIFYKITNGKRPMPPMQRKMSETERWQVVRFLRTLKAS